MKEQSFEDRKATETPIERTIREQRRVGWLRKMHMKRVAAEQEREALRRYGNSRGRRQPSP